MSDKFKEGEMIGYRVNHNRPDLNLYNLITVVEVEVREYLEDADSYLIRFKDPINYKVVSHGSRLCLLDDNLVKVKDLMGDIQRVEFLVSVGVLRKNEYISNKYFDRESGELWR